MKRIASLKPRARAAGVSPDAEQASRDRRRVLLSVAAIVGVLVLLALAGWRFWTFLGTEQQPTVDRGELQALDARLTAVRAAITPIAVAFTSQSATAPIDVASYRERIEAARSVVSSVNDVALTSPETIEIRDMIITGGAQVLEGMDAALTALESDEASAAEGASATVEEGLGVLDEAAARIQELLGTRSST